jgi:hypothetical protein
VTGGRILDWTAIVDIARRDTGYGAALLTVGTDRGLTLTVPAAALLKAWAWSTPESRPFLDLLPLLAPVEIHPVDDALAAEVGALAADAGRPTTSAGTAQAVRLAQTRPWPIVTADP